MRSRSCVSVNHSSMSACPLSAAARRGPVSIVLLNLPRRSSRHSASCFSRAFFNFFQDLARFFFPGASALAFGEVAVFLCCLELLDGLAWSFPFALCGGFTSAGASAGRSLPNCGAPVPVLPATCARTRRPVFDTLLIPSGVYSLAVLRSLVVCPRRGGTSRR